MPHWTKKHPKENVQRAVLWAKNNPEKFKLNQQKYRDDHKQERNIKNKIYRQQRKQQEKSRLTKWRIKNPEKAHAQWRRQWKNRPYVPLDSKLEEMKCIVRQRDNNTCKWYACGLTNRDAPIHVHHIFPRSEYPELKYDTRYMICYCANHHGLFHRYRGDKYFKFLTNNPRYRGEKS